MRMKETIKISVIIPVYNAERYLRECLDSVSFQLLEDIEILCIDDGSRDGSLRILNSYAEKDKRFLIFKQNNCGAGAARNLGIEKARGEYISFLDADDLYPDENVLSRLYQKANENNADICGGSLLMYRNKKRFKNDKKISSFEKEGWMSFADLQWDYEFYRYLYRRQFLINNGICFPDYRRYQDPPFLLKAMIEAKVFYAIKENVYCYRFARQNYDSYDFEKTNDLAKGIFECVKMAKENDLQIVVRRNLDRIRREFAYVFEKSISEGNSELIRILKQISEMTDTDLDMLLNRKKSSDTDMPSYESDQKSVMEKLVFSIRMNGLSYTFARILFHLHLKKDNDPVRTKSVNRM